MYLAQKNQVRRLDRRKYEILRSVTHLAKNVYNEMNYGCRNHYELNGTCMSYADMCFSVKASENYFKMPSQVGQQVLKVLEKNWRSFFILLRERRKGNYNRPVRIPGFLPRDGHLVCIFQRQSFRVIGDEVRLSLGRWFKMEEEYNFLYFKVPKNVPGGRIKEVRLHPRYRGRFFELEFVYEVDVVQHDLDRDKFMGIDLGVNNLAACVSTGGASFILEGRGLKSYNHWWNKRKARLASRYEKNGVRFGRKMVHLLRDRRNRITNFMAQNVNYVVKHCLENEIGNVVVGELGDIKRGINLGGKNNQNFQYVPLGLFKQKLRSKCELNGIRYHEVSEAYTSRTCSRCGRVRKANRKHRGLYVCDRCNLEINADTNGAINIVKKVAPEALGGGGSGTVDVPRRVRIPGLLEAPPFMAG